MWITARGLAAGLCLLVTAATAGCGRAQDRTARPVDAARSGTAAAGRCTWRPTGGPYVKDVGTPPAGAGTQTTMTITTNLGTVTVRLDPAGAPCTVASFAHLAGKRYFDRTGCHRLVTRGIYVLQCGDPSGTGSGGRGSGFDDRDRPG